MEPQPRHEVLDSVEALSGQLDALAGAVDRAWALSDGQARDAVEALVRLESRLASIRLAAVKDLDARPSAVAGAVAGRTAATFLIHRLGMDPARACADVRAAHALDPDSGELPEVGAALAAGDITPDHAHVCVRALGQLPKRLTTVALDDEDGVTRTGLQIVDRWLAQQCRTQGVRSASLLVRQLLERLDPDRTHRFDPDAHLRRDLTLGTDPTGMGLLRGTLTPADTAVLRSFLSAAAAPNPATEAVQRDAEGNEQTILVRDDRTTGMRRYDALMGLIRSAVRGHTTTDAPTPDVKLLITATLEQVHAAATTTGTPGTATRAGTATGAGAGAGAGRTPPAGLAQLHRTGPISPALLGFLTCSATIRRVLLAPSGQPLDVGRAQRFATPTQRLALTVRDGGCIIPGCTCPPEGCDVHHLTPWAHGGTTDLNNQVMLCAAHHQQVHAGIWTIEIHPHDGIPWVKPPPWIDRHQHPTRNLHHHTAAQARRIGEQLRLALDDDGG